MYVCSSKRRGRNKARRGNRDKKDKSMFISSCTHTLIYSYSCTRLHEYTYTHTYIHSNIHTHIIILHTGARDQAAADASELPIDKALRFVFDGTYIHTYTHTYIHTMCNICVLLLLISLCCLDVC